jgi:hypothetical protein
MAFCHFVINWTNTLNIKDLPLEQLYADFTRYGAKDFLASKDNFVARNYLAKNYKTVLPSILHYFSTLPTSAALVGGKIDCNAYLKPHMNDWLKGLLVLSVLVPRSKLCNVKVTHPTMSDYNTLVPLILAAHKKYHDIPYTAWDTNSLSGYVSKALLEAMRWDSCHSDEFMNAQEHRYLESQGVGVDDEANEAAEVNINDFTSAYVTKYKKGYSTVYGFSNETLREYRDECIKGDARTTYRLVYAKDYVFNRMPHLVKVMALQMWAAHPDNRGAYMVLNPDNWDDMPDALVADEIFVVPETAELELPWI